MVELLLVVVMLSSTERLVVDRITFGVYPTSAECFSDFRKASDHGRKVASESMHQLQYIKLTCDRIQ